LGLAYLGWLYEGGNEDVEDVGSAASEDMLFEDMRKFVIAKVSFFERWLGLFRT
jgi:hypothetical protein